MSRTGMLAMFGMVITQGVRMLAPEIAMEAALGVGLGIGGVTVPGIFANLLSWMSILTSNGIVAGSVTVIF